MEYKNIQICFQHGFNIKTQWKTPKAVHYHDFTMVQGFLKPFPVVKRAACGGVSL